MTRTEAQPTPPRRKSPIQPLREAVICGSAVFVVLAGMVIWNWRASIASQTGRTLAEIGRIAEVTTSLIDRDVYATLVPDAGSDQEILAAETARLTHLLRSQPNLAGLYALSPRGTSWIRVLDAQGRDRFGDFFVPPAAREAFMLRQTAHSDEYVTDLGNVVSVFTPIVNDNGDTLGVVGVDILAANVRNLGGQADRTLINGLVLALLGAVGVGLVTHRIRSTLRDLMSEQDARVAALEKHSEVLSRAQEHSGSMLASMSHEVRTPLTAILGFTELLLEPNDNVSVLRSHAQTIRRNSHHLLDVLNDALDISKLDAGMMRVHPQPFDPKRLLQEVTALFEPRAMEKFNTLRFVEEGTVPDSVSSDEFRVRQILLNLLSNGLKFTDKGTVTVTVAYDAANSTLQYRVTDTGIGIEPDQLARIFEPYQQSLNDDVRRFGGTGLGLAISRRIAELLKGSLTVQSRPGDGSSFVLRLHAPVVSAAERASQPLSVADTWKPRPSWRVLVVEDTLEHQKLLFAILRRAGHSVDVCETGERALTLLREADYLREPYTVIVVDAHLPGMSGSQTARSIREHGFHGPILGWTADETDETRAACLHAGCDDVILKPTDATKLLSALSRLLHGPKSLGAA